MGYLLKDSRLADGMIEARETQSCCQCARIVTNPQEQKQTCPGCGQWLCDRCAVLTGSCHHARPSPQQEARWRAWLNRALR